MVSVLTPGSVYMGISVLKLPKPMPASGWAAIILFAAFHAAILFSLDSLSDLFGCKSLRTGELGRASVGTSSKTLIIVRLRRRRRERHTNTKKAAMSPRNPPRDAQRVIATIVMSSAPVY